MLSVFIALYSALFLSQINSPEISSSLYAEVSTGLFSEFSKYAECGTRLKVSI